MAFWSWSKTAATNATADTSVNWAEGQSPSSVNDSARAMMARLAEYRDDTGGSVAATGTASAYVVTSNQVFTSTSDLNTRSITFIVQTDTNAAGVTLNVDGIGAYPIVYGSGNAIPAGALIAGGVYTATFYSGASQWRVRDFYAIPYNIPVGGIIPYAGSTAPNSNFAIPLGQAISRTTYATLFALIGTTYGVGDGTTTFNLPDLGGRVVAGKEATATRLTTAGGGVDGGTLGAVGGAQNQTLLTANLPPYSPAGSVSVTSTTSQIVSASGASDNFTSIAGSSVITSQTRGAVTSSGTLTGTAQGGTSTPVKTVQPTIVLNSIMRVL